jgi:hypothetical protein
MQVHGAGTNINRPVLPFPKLQEFVSNSSSPTASASIPPSPSVCAASPPLPVSDSNGTESGAVQKSVDEMHDQAALTNGLVSGTEECSINDNTVAPVSHHSTFAPFSEVLAVESHFSPQNENFKLPFYFNLELRSFQDQQAIRCAEDADIPTPFVPITRNIITHRSQLVSQTELCFSYIVS